jgi:hypothetical protein
MKVTAPEALTVRPLPEICQHARQVNCGECWQVPGTPCTPEGDHVARFGRAMRRGLISGPDLLAVLGDTRRVHHGDRDLRCPGRCAMTADGRRIADLERQVAQLTARVEQVASRAAVVRSLEEIFLGEPGRSDADRAALRMAFAAGRACERGDTAPHLPVRRPRHLQAVEACHA